MVGFLWFLVLGIKLRVLHLPSIFITIELYSSQRQRFLQTWGFSCAYLSTGA
jgi:hypothetical protein